MSTSKYEEAYYTPNGDLIGGINLSYLRPGQGYADVDDYTGATITQHDLDWHKVCLKQGTGKIERIFRPIDEGLLYVLDTFYPHDFVFWQVPQVHRAAQDFLTNAYRIIEHSSIRQTIVQACSKRSDIEKLLGFRIPKEVFDPFATYLHGCHFSAFTGQIDGLTISASIELTVDRYDDRPVDGMITFQCPDDVRATCSCLIDRNHAHGRCYSTTRFRTNSDYIRQKAFFVSSYSSYTYRTSNFCGVLRPEQIPTIFALFRQLQPDPEITKLLLQRAYCENFNKHGCLPYGPCYPFNHRSCAATGESFYDDTRSSLAERWRAESIMWTY